MRLITSVVAVSITLAGTGEGKVTTEIDVLKQVSQLVCNLVWWFHREREGDEAFCLPAAKGT